MIIGNNEGANEKKFVFVKFLLIYQYFQHSRDILILKKRKTL